MAVDCFSRGVVHSEKSSYTPQKTSEKSEKIQKITQKFKKIQKIQQFLEEYIEQFSV